MKYSRLFFRIYFILSLGFLVTALHAEQLLLIAGKEVSITPLSANEVKKLFLAAPVTRQGERLIPLINRSDALTYQIFLQSVMGRSAYTYEKQVLTRFYSSGVTVPTTITTQDELYEILNSQRGSISFILESDFSDSNGMQNIQKLWEGNVQ